MFALHRDDDMGNFITRLNIMSGKVSEIQAACKGQKWVDSRFANRASGIPIMSQMAKLLRRQKIVTKEKPPDMEYPPPAQTDERPRTPSAVRAHEVPSNSFWTPSKALLAMLEEQQQNQTYDERDDVTGGSGSDRTIVDQNDHFLVLKPPSRNGLGAAECPTDISRVSSVPHQTLDDMSLPGAVEMVPGLTLRPSTRQVGASAGTTGDVRGALPGQSRPATDKTQAPGSTQRSGTTSHRGSGTRAISARASSRGSSRRSRKSTALTIEELYAEVC
jgi:hypothetical protein